MHLCNFDAGLCALLSNVHAYKYAYIHTLSWTRRVSLPLPIVLIPMHSAWCVWPLAEAGFETPSHGA